MTLRRKIVVPTIVLAAIVAVMSAYVAWDSARQARTLERDTQGLRVAAVLAFSLGDAAQDEERHVLAIRGRPGEFARVQLAEAGARIAVVLDELDRLALPPRAVAIIQEFRRTYDTLRTIQEDVLRASGGGDAAALDRALEQWNLMSRRADSIVKDLMGYYLRSLDRTVAELQERRARTLRAAAAGVAVGLLVAIGFAIAIAGAVVTPIVAMARAAEEISRTGRAARVAGAGRRDEIGTLARAFNRMTESLLSANAELEEADRRKNEFLGVLSHELRNPLAPIGNAVHVLRHPGASDEARVRAKATLHRQVHHLTRLVDDLLDVTRVARGKIELHRERVDVEALVQRVAEDHRSLMAERGIDFAVRTPGAPVWLDADPVRVAQIIGNLLQNAAKFTQHGGGVTLELVTVGGCAEIRVRDDGVGMDAALLARVFEPFVQAERSLARGTGGLGLGLALVRSIAELHGGSARAESGGPGRGSELAVSLPLAAGEKLVEA